MAANDDETIEVLEDADLDATGEAMAADDDQTADAAMVEEIAEVDEEPASAPGGVQEVSDSGIFSVLAIGSALFYLLALVMAMIALREYSDPERFLRFW